jgi:GNAT superfamily N-acetyltransferase
MNYEIRKVKPEEVKTALDLALHVFMEYEAPIYSSEGTQKFTKDHIENEKHINSYISGKHLMLGAFYGKRIIGLVSERGNGRISMVFVDKEYHRQGVATSIMERMVVALRLQGHNKITLISSPYAVSFFKHFGFIETEMELKKDGFIFTPMEYTPRELWDVYDKNRVKIGKVVERGRPMS